ncbi:MAG: NUDIX domain-containing protein [Trueperaceae bacterium]
MSDSTVPTRSTASPPPARATVGALLVDPAGRSLFVRTAKWRGRWGVPGGKIEPGETIADAVRREVHEETGLAAFDLRWAPTLQAVRSPAFAHDAHFVLLNLVARSDGGAVRLNHEASEARWCRPVDALLGLDLNRPTRALVLHYLSHGHAGPAVREGDDA